MPQNTNSSEYAFDDSDAADRFVSWKHNDPFPAIQPALLNSADIKAYVGKTGMVHPFSDSSEKLKPASYEVDIGNEYLWWDDSGEKRQEKLKKGETFVLRKNSIMFIMVEPKFRLPSYIAIRFNLKITHVYRGLLLGTGPLVDPEYEGHLFIPLHNLTDNDYVFSQGEGLIWVEFTKISANAKWSPGFHLPSEYGVGEVDKFPIRKKDQGLSYFIRKAEPHRPIRSSIPNEIKAAKDSAVSAKKQAWYVSIAAIAFLFTVGSFVIASMNFVNSRANTLEQKIDVLQKRIADLENRKNP